MTHLGYCAYRMKQRVRRQLQHRRPLQKFVIVRKPFICLVLIDIVYCSQHPILRRSQHPNQHPNQLQHQPRHRLLVQLYWFKFIFLFGLKYVL